MTMRKWAVVTGAGSGIGAALSKKLVEKNYSVIGVGRRLKALERTEQDIKQLFFSDTRRGLFKKIAVDISDKNGRLEILRSIPRGDILSFLVHNAAVGDPSKVNCIDVDHFRYAMEVNVTAPLALTQLLFPQLKHESNEEGGRVLHLGTGVAHQLQIGTGTYGITKSAFFRLYQQLSLDYEGTNVYVASARPGVVKTEGLLDHVVKANALRLPHSEFFNDLLHNNEIGKSGQMQVVDVVAEFLFCLLTKCPKEDFGTKEWSVNETTPWWIGSERAHL